MIGRLSPVVAAAVLAVSGCGSGQDAAASSVECPPAEGAAERVTEFESAPPMCIDEEKTYSATVSTDAGDIVIDLDAEAAPKTVNNFVVLARYQFYDGLTFHRVIEGFMAQGGDPAGDGSGGPGYTVKDELPQAGDYEEGSVAMANRGPDTNGSQFFIVTGDAGVALPPDYSLFAAVTKGMDVVEEIEADGSSGEGPPAAVHTIERVTITEE